MHESAEPLCQGTFICRTGVSDIAGKGATVHGSTLHAVYVMTERALACAGNLGWWMLFNGEAPMFCATVMLFCLGKSLGNVKSSEFQSSEGTTMDSVASTIVVSSSESNAMERWKAKAAARSVCAGL